MEGVSNPVQQMASSNLHDLPWFGGNISIPLSPWLGRSSAVPPPSPPRVLPRELEGEQPLPGLCGRWQPGRGQQQYCIKAPSRGLSLRRVWEMRTSSGITLGILILPPEQSQLEKRQ